MVLGAAAEEFSWPGTAVKKQEEENTQAREFQRLALPQHLNCVTLMRLWAEGQIFDLRMRHSSYFFFFLCVALPSDEKGHTKVKEKEML